MIFNILDNTTELWMTKYIIGEIFSSGGATLYKNPSDQTVFSSWWCEVIVSLNMFFPEKTLENLYELSLPAQLVVLYKFLLTPRPQLFCCDFLVSSQQFQSKRWNIIEKLVESTAVILIYVHTTYHTNYTSTSGFRCKSL